MLQLINKYQQKVTDFQYILILVLLELLLDVIFTAMTSLLEPYLGSFNGQYVTSISMAVFVCIVAPFFESLLVSGLVGLFHKKFKLKKVVVLFLTTSIFALLHNYSILYIIEVFPCLFLLVYSYMYYEGKKISSFNIMLLIHMFNNIIIVISQLIC